MLDELDSNILSLLREDGRMAINTIAKKLDTRRATIHARYSKMISNGIIKGFTVVPNWKKLGYSITVFILVSILRQTPIKGNFEAHLNREIRKIPFIVEIHHISGEFDLLLKARVQDLETTGTEIVFKLKKIRGIGRTLTMTTFVSTLEELDVQEQIKHLF
ncbi:MAG: Lrp/AsnC family transcriptional regulator [Candidatus Heimdallarchaeota archaeon]|nr:Lrp/AsnC family transcriptional regulator [Candidatus Heimdallarchaeota archaeon]